jgi:hypothetical protein
LDPQVGTKLDLGGFKNILIDVFCPKERDEDTNVEKSFDCFEKTFIYYFLIF